MNGPGYYFVVVPAEPGALAMVRAFFEPLLRRVCSDDADQVILALDEACANVVKHRAEMLDDGLIRVHAETDDGLLRFRLGRFCRAQDVAGIRPRDLADIRPGGLGTCFIDKIMDRVDYVDDPECPGSMTLVLEKAVPRGEEE